MVTALRSVVLFMFVIFLSAATWSQISGIHGTVFDDLNGNGIREGAEPGVQGWIVILSGTSDSVRVTDATGSYFYSLVEPGFHTIKVIVFSGWTATNPPGGIYSFTLPETTFATVDFGVWRSPLLPGLISGMKFADIDSNGYRDSQDIPLANWRIYLSLAGQTAPHDSALTDMAGRYTFGPLPPGTYEVRELNQDRWTQTYPSFPFYVLTVDSSLSVFPDIDFGNYRRVDRDTSRSIVFNEIIAPSPEAPRLKAFEFPAALTPAVGKNESALPGDALPVGTVISAWDSSVVITLTSEKYFYWIDLSGDLKYGHPCLYVLVDKFTAAVDTFSTSWWPVVTLPGALAALDPIRLEMWSSWDERVSSPDLIYGTYNGYSAIPHDSYTLPAPKRQPTGMVATSAAAILIGGKAESPTELATWQHDLDSMYEALVNSSPPAVDPAAVYMWNNTTIDTLDAFLSYVRTRDTLYFYFTGHGDSSKGGGIVMNHEGGLITRVSLTYDELATVFFDSLDLKNLNLLIDASKAGHAIDDFMRPVEPVVELVTSTDKFKASQAGLPTDTSSIYTKEWKYQQQGVPLPPGEEVNWMDLNDTVRAANPTIRTQQNPIDTSNAALFEGDRASFIFPNVAVGQATNLTIDVQNEGWIDLEIDSIRTTDPSFVIVGDDTGKLRSRNLGPPYLEKTFTLQFAPTSAGPHLGSVIFYHNSLRSTTVIPIGGTAVAPADTVKYRTFVQDSLLSKGVKKKPYSVKFKAQFINTTASTYDGMKIKFNQIVQIDDDGPFTGSGSTNGKEWSLNGQFINPGDTVLIACTGAKGKPVTVSNWWWTLGGTLGAKQVKFIPPNQQLLLPMPTSGNLVDSVFRQGGFGPTGMIVGVPRTDSVKSYGWMRFTKGKNFQKFLVQTGPIGPFDTLKTSPFKPFVKEQKNLKNTKYNNRLAGELAVLKLSIAASALGKTPLGLGELVYDDSAGNILNGLQLKQIVARADSAMTMYKTKPSWLYTVLDSTIRRINLAFSGPLDTTSFGPIFVLKGVKTPIETGFIHANPSIAPLKIEPGIVMAELPERFELFQNYPNPFNPRSTIEFLLPSTSLVSLKVYNLLGQEVAVLLDREEMDDGDHQVEFDAADLSSGVYFYRLTAQSFGDPDEGIHGGMFVDVKKMLLLK